MKRFVISLLILTLALSMHTFAFTESPEVFKSDSYIQILDMLKDIYQTDPSEFSDDRVVLLYDTYCISMHMDVARSVISSGNEGSVKLVGVKLLSEMLFQFDESIYKTYRDWLDGNLTNQKCAEQMFETIDMYLDVR